MKLALVFPGQGSQSPGMGKSFFDEIESTRDLFALADQTLGYKLTETLFFGTEEDLKRTEVTQPAIFTVSAAAFVALKKAAPELLEQVRFYAGHSLGEYSAYFAAGAFDLQTGLKLVKYRGQFIQEAAEKTTGSMSAVLNCEPGKLNALALELTQGSDFLEAVNFNSPGQTVVAGTPNALQSLAEKLGQEAGVKVIALAVSGAFHSRAMRPAAMRMEQILQEAQISDIQIPVIANVDAQATQQASAIRQKLTLQIDHPVLWEDSMRKMIAEGVDTFIELGPGRVLAGIAKKIDRKLKFYSIYDTNSLKAALAELQVSAA